MKATCKKCGKKYRMGYTGTIDGCDECLDIKRDKHGHAWNKDERKNGAAYQDIATGTIQHRRWDDEK